MPKLEVGFDRWDLVLIACVLILLFLYGILRPRNRVEWRSAGLASAWVIALYAEMYGFPLTLYLLSLMLGPHLAPTDFQRGHLWAPLLRIESTGLNLILVVVSSTMILSGAALALLGWREVWKHRDSIATEGIYRWMRHPQYTGFFLFIVGSMINWPTIITLVMVPVLVWRYWRLSQQEEAYMLAQFGHRYAEYAARTGRFLPRLLPAR